MTSIHGLSLRSEKLWIAFCEAIGRPELARHPEYATNALRVKNRAVLEPILAEIFLTQTADVWVEKLSAVGMPCSPVKTIAEVAEDAQAAVREMFPVLQHPTAGECTVTGLPIKFSETPGRLQAAAPRLGEHTRESLAELLDLDAARLDELERSGVIWRDRIPSSRESTGGW